MRIWVCRELTDAGIKYGVAEGHRDDFRWLSDLFDTRAEAEAEAARLNREREQDNW